MLFPTSIVVIETQIKENKGRGTEQESISIRKQHSNNHLVCEPIN